MSKGFTNIPYTNRLIVFCGVDAHHQNSIAEEKKDISNKNTLIDERDIGTRNVQNLYYNW